MKHRTYFTFAGLVLASMFLVGEVFAQAVPSLVTQQTRMSTGGGNPNYVQHRAITTVGAAPGANGWYAWDQVPAPAADSNYLLFLNATNEVHRTKSFGSAVANKLVAVNSTGTNLDYIDLSSLVHANNGLHISGDTVQLGGPLNQQTSIDLNAFNLDLINGTASNSTLTLGNSNNTFNINVNVGTSGNLNLTNIDQDSTTITFLTMDNTGNVRTRDLSGLVAADNGLTFTTGAQTVVHLGGTATGSAPLLTNRFVDLNGKDLNFEGATGNLNLGTAAGNVNTNVNTGTTGVMTLQGTTLPSTTGINNFLFVNGATNEVHKANTLSLDSNATPDQYITIDNTGKVTRSQSPVINFLRGQIPGTGTFTYTSPNMNIQAGAAINCTVENHTGINGAIVVQVTNVTTGVAGHFDVETSENIQNGSFINYSVMNP
jgi:hypothetical protein